MEHNADAADPSPTYARDMRLVQRIATGVQRAFGLADVVDVPELVQFGWVGLLEARARFENERGADFRLYAHQRIRGAMLDGIRKATNLPRGAYRKLRMAQMEVDDDVQFGDELSTALDSGRLFRGSGFMVVQSPYPTEPAPEQPSPEDDIHEKRRFERLQMTVDELGEPDRTVARRRVIEGESLAAIAEDLGISRPWAWRVLERALRNIILVMDAG